MWLSVLLVWARLAHAEDCFAEVAYQVTLQVETVPPGAEVVVERSPDPAFVRRSLGVAPISWVYNYHWVWDEGNCDGMAPDDSWGAGPGHVVSSIDVFDTFSVAAHLEGYQDALVPVRVHHCEHHEEIQKKAYFGRLRKITEIHQCTETVRIELAAEIEEIVEVAPVPTITSNRLVEGCKTDKDCATDARCGGTVCVPR
jgi:hypothetical protein